MSVFILHRLYRFCIAYDGVSQEKEFVLNGRFKLFYFVNELSADPDIKTLQFKNKNDMNIFLMGWLANENENGLSKENIKTNTGTSSDHSIFTFFNDISSLSDGKYKWNGSKSEKQ